MKYLPFSSLFTVCVLSWSCGTIDPDASIRLPGARGPLETLRLAPSQSAAHASSAAASSLFQPGDYVEVSTENAAFYDNYPKGRAAAKKSLSMGTTLVVLQLDGKYLHVQGEDSSIGYVESAAVVPQGILVTSGTPAADLVEVNWSDIAEGQAEGAQEVELKVDEMQVSESTDSATEPTIEEPKDSVVNEVSADAAEVEKNVEKSVKPQE